MIFSMGNGGVGWVESGVGSGFPFHLLVLTVSGGEVWFEVSPSFFSGWFLVPTATGAHELPCCKYFCISNVDLLGGTYGDSSCLWIVSTVLNLLEEGLNWLLGIPCSAHVLEVDLQVNRCDVAMGLEEMVHHLSRWDVGISHHNVIQDLQVHGLQCSNDLLLQSFLDR
jgi:hypothetical protein